MRLDHLLSREISFLEDDNFIDGRPVSPADAVFAAPQGAQCPVPGGLPRRTLRAA